MAISALYDPGTREGCLYCTATNRPFGPVFEDVDGADMLHRFVAWLADGHGGDPREAHDDDLVAWFRRFRAEGRVETRPALRCGHCWRVFDPNELVPPASSTLWNPAPCPACGQGDGDFEEVRICRACLEVCIDRALHVSCFEPAEEPQIHVAPRKPPVPSVRRQRRAREA